MRCVDSREQILQELTRRMREVEVSARLPSGEGSCLSTGIEPVDRLLRRSRLPNEKSPAEGFLPGTLIEWLKEGSGSGAEWLALKIAAHVCCRGTSAASPAGASLRSSPGHPAGGALVVIDRQREFYPPAVAGLGLELDRFLVIHPQNAAEELWALEQTLRCPGVTVTLCRLDRMRDRVLRRLQLAAEMGGSLGFLVRPARTARDPCWGDVRLLVRAVGRRERRPGTWRVHLEVLQFRGRTGGETVELEIDDETGDVHLASPLVSPAPVPRAARA